jgi:hypothetical protein
LDHHMFNFELLVDLLASPFITIRKFAYFEHISFYSGI